jgi:hypothetical protein
LESFAVRIEREMTPSSLLVGLAEKQFGVISHWPLLAPGTGYLAAMPRANPLDSDEVCP